MKVISKSAFCGFGENVPVPLKYRSPTSPCPGTATASARDSIGSLGDFAIRIRATDDIDRFSKKM
jgi:hypothetical protein